MVLQYLPLDLSLKLKENREGIECEKQDSSDQIPDYSGFTTYQYENVQQRPIDLTCKSVKPVNTVENTNEYIDGDSTNHYEDFQDWIINQLEEKAYYLNNKDCNGLVSHISCQPTDVNASCYTETFSDYVVKGRWEAHRSTETTVYAATIPCHEEDEKSRKLYQCSVCDRVYKQVRAYRAHVLTHRDANRLICDMCGDELTSSPEYLNHLKAHGVKSLLRCQYCSKFFRDNCTLRSHLLIHTGERPHKCDICHKSFRQTGTLSRHIRTHFRKSSAPRFQTKS